MKKIFLLIAGIVIILVTVFLLLPRRTDLEITDIKFEDYQINFISDPHGYGLQLNPEENAHIKKVDIFCNIKNISLKPVYGVWLAFDHDQTLPEIIQGTKLNTTKVESINLDPFESSAAKYSFLIDSKDYNNEELYSLISNVNLFVMEINNSLKNRSHKIISTKPVKCSIRDYTNQ